MPAPPICDPPLVDSYGGLRYGLSPCSPAGRGEEYCELPVIDFGGLTGGAGERERRACAAEVARAASEWGFFQVVNHGISRELLGGMRREQRELFGRLPFERKAASCCRLLEGAYRWGTPTASTAGQFSWSEAFHIHLSKIYDDDDGGDEEEFRSLREMMRRYAGAIAEVAMALAGVLVENLGQTAGFLERSCSKSTCFLRLNRYPPCPFSPEVFGLVPHTDSDFLTVLHQDDVGGLQLKKDSRWVAVKPNPDALIVNIGDLFQAWSNDVYKSLEHRVMANGKTDRYSAAYFVCPSYDAVVGACGEPSVYRSFTFREYRRQVQDDVKKTGQKVGLSRFLCSQAIS